MVVASMARHVTTPYDPNRSTDEQLAERMLAAALANYHAVTTGKGTMSSTKTWPELDPAQQKFYLEFAIPRALAAIWEGK